MTKNEGLMKQIIELIKKHDWDEIFNYVEPLDDKQRIELQKELASVDFQKLDNDDGFEMKGKAREAFFDNRQENLSALEYAKLISIRSFDELKEAFPNEMAHMLFGSAFRKSNFSQEPKIQFFKKYPPNYLDKVIKASNVTTIDFDLLWVYYKNGWLKFNEEFFVNSLFYVQMFTRDTEKDANFLIENPKAIEKVLLQFHKYEIDILDISKWESREGFQCTKIHKFWTEVFTILIEKGIEIPRVLITNLLESLLNHWKKPHLNWHIQIIKLLEPTPKELIINQNLIFSALNSENNTIVNYAVSVIKSIHKLKEFDFETYYESVSVLFVNDKVNKSLLASLKIIDFGVSKNEAAKDNVAEQLCLGLTASNTEIQFEFASRIAEFCPPEKLDELITPYVSYLKSKSKEILGAKKKSETKAPQLTANKIEILEISYPKNWEELLQHISTTIRTRNATDIDVLLESINQLNDQLPPNYQKLLSSYKKQLSREWWDSLMRDFSDFFQNWVNNSAVYQFQNYNSNPTRLPFLNSKFLTLFNKLKANDKLPFLSTPTHTPCYIHPEILIDRLLTYEKSDSEIDWIDLTVACNRILKNIPCNDFADKANSLQGKYASAINYLIGNSNEIELKIKTEKPKKRSLKSLFSAKKNSQENEGEFVTEEQLNLWAQVTRTKNVDGVYIEFKNTALESSETVINPLNIDFEIITNKSDNFTWYSLIMEEKWNTSALEYKQLNNYAYSSPFHLAETSADICYQASLVINYIDPLLCSYVSIYSSDDGIHSAPLKYMLDNNIAVHHSGWIYVANCVLTKDKETRAMGQEYLLQAIANKTMKQDVLSAIIAKIIVTKYAPVKRLTDYVEQVTEVNELNELHFTILCKCIELVDSDDKPRSFPKIITLFKELQKDLNVQSNDALMAKVNSFKK
ncbi:MAG: hypothetical protein ACI8ZM_002513 [Crocinitomix sp.]